MTIAHDAYKPRPLTGGRLYLYFYLADDTGIEANGGLLPILLETAGVAEFWATGNTETGGAVQDYAPVNVLANAASVGLDVGIVLARPYGNVNLSATPLVNGNFIGGHIPDDYESVSLRGDHITIDPNTEGTLREILGDVVVDDYLGQWEAIISPLASSIYRPIGYASPPPVYDDLTSVLDHAAKIIDLGFIVGIDSFAVIDSCYDSVGDLTGDAFTTPIGMDHVNGHGETCLLWFQADYGVNGATDANEAEDDELIDSWTDRSYNANEATNDGSDLLSPPPTYRELDGPGGTRPCIRFAAGAGQKLTLGAAAASTEGITIAVVHKTAAGIQNNLLASSTTGSVAQVTAGNQLGIVASNEAGTTSDSTIARDVWGVSWFEVIEGEEGDSANFFQNGDDLVSSSIDSNGFSFDTIGGGVSLGTLDIFAIIVFKGVLNENSRRLLHNFIERETGITLSGSDIAPELAEIPAAKFVKVGLLPDAGPWVCYEPFDTNQSDRINDFSYTYAFGIDKGQGIVAISNRHLAGFDEASIIATGFDDNGGRYDIATLYAPSTAVTYTRATIQALSADPATYRPRAAAIIGNNGGTVASRIAAIVRIISDGDDVWADPAGMTTAQQLDLFGQIVALDADAGPSPTGTDRIARIQRIGRLNRFSTGRGR